MTATIVDRPPLELLNERRNISAIAWEARRGRPRRVEGDFT